MVREDHFFLGKKRGGAWNQAWWLLFSLLDAFNIHNSWSMSNHYIHTCIYPIRELKSIENPNEKFFFSIYPIQYSILVVVVVDFDNIVREKEKNNISHIKLLLLIFCFVFCFFPVINTSVKRLKFLFFFIQKNKKSMQPLVS